MKGKKENRITRKKTAKLSFSAFLHPYRTQSRLSFFSSLKFNSLYIHILLPIIIITFSISTRSSNFNSLLLSPFHHFRSQKSNFNNPLFDWIVFKTYYNNSIFIILIKFQYISICCCFPIDFAYKSENLEKLIILMNLRNWFDLKFRWRCKES